MRGRRLQRNHNSEIPDSHIVFDTETADTISSVDGTQKHALRFGQAVYWRRERGRITRRQTFRWEENAAFWDWVSAHLSKERTTRLWAHNVGFDLTITRFWDQWQAGRYVGKWHVLEDAPTILCGHFDQKKVIIGDTYNYFPTSVAKMGDWLGLPKLPMPGSDSFQWEWDEYCMRDVEIVEGVVNRLCDLVRELDLGCLRYTLAGQAMQHFRHLDGSIMPVVPPGGRDAHLARDGYYSGRADLFFCGHKRERIIVLDCNAIYGHIMATHPLPAAHVCYTDRGQELLDGGTVPVDHCLATVDLDTPTVYPVRVPDVGTVWAVGQFRTTLCGPELRAAWEQGHVQAVHRLSVYQLDYCLKAFAEYWLRRRNDYRAAGDKIMECFAKSMCPALYGKWGEKSPKWVPIGPTGEDCFFGPIQYLDSSTGYWHPGRSIAGIGEVDVSRALRRRPGSEAIEPVPDGTKLARGETEHSFPALSAWITTHARLLMDQFRAVAGQGEVYYQCNDAVHVRQRGYERLLMAGLVHPTEPGKLKVADVLHDVEYHGVNLLRIDGKLKAAGLPGRHWIDAEGKPRALSFERLASILTRRIDGTVEIKETAWEPDYQYSHGIKTDSGWIDPIRLPRESS